MIAIHTILACGCFLATTAVIATYIIDKITKLGLNWFLKILLGLNLFVVYVATNIWFFRLFSVSP